MCVCVFWCLLVNLSVELPGILCKLSLSPMIIEIWFLVPHGVKGDVLCLMFLGTSRDNGTKERSKGNKQREFQRKDNSNYRQIIFNEQGFFVEVTTRVAEPVGTSTLC
jgi:hypothetical protein